MSSEMPKEYDPREAESRWYAFWDERGLFTAGGDEDDAREPYTTNSIFNRSI